jgi:RHS repeat-associated protein
MYYAGLNPLTVFGVTLTNNDVLTAKDQTSIDDGALRSWTHTDGFGRTIDAFTRDPQGDVRATTTYDGLGRAKRVTSPYRGTSDPTYGYSDTTYDLAGRATRVETFSGGGVSTGAVTTAYSGSQVTVTDQAAKVRRSVSDGLGRLKQVIEDPNSLAYSTTYGYDAMDDLTSVTQGSQARTFVYDGLKRLTQAVNPENGTINYSLYDGNSNLLQKTDARGITTTYAYDALNRVTSRTYSDTTPAVAYKYDAQSLPTGAPSFTRGSSTGRLVAVTHGGSSAGNYSGYDQLGRVNSSYQQTDSQNYGFGYGYNLASEMTTENYPSGRAITTAYDASGRISTINGQKAGEANKTYASQFSYAPHGAVTAMLVGNGKWEHTSFNTRLQPTLIGLGTSTTDSTTLKLDYTYGSTTNNGNVQSQTITVGATVMSQSYGYDALNRLNSASEGTAWTQTYSYDRFGNRAVTGYVPSGLTPQSLAAFNAGNNRMVASLYDAAGNQTADAQNRTFSYDAENRQITFNGTANQYFYDGDGRRVKKIDSTGTTVFVYNAGGQLIAEYHSDPVPPPTGGGGTGYLTTDHLGSTRVVTDGQGNVKARYDYLPFGEELPSSVGSRSSVVGYSGADSTKQKFTQKERDTESGLDYFLARYYSSAQGRFTSADPIFIAGERVIDPQQLNLYPYARNNPLRFTDPTGEIINEPTGLSREDQEKYDKWKAAYLSTASGKATWKKYQDDQDFTLNVLVADRGSEGANKGAEVHDNVFDASGNYVGATMTLGKNIGSGVPSETEYPITSQVGGEKSETIAMTKIAHEFGHLDDNRSLGRAFYQLQQAFDAYNARQAELTAQRASPSARGNDLVLGTFSRQFQLFYGATMDAVGTSREIRAERATIPVLRGHFGKNMPSPIKSSIEKYEKTHP